MHGKVEELTAVMTPPPDGGDHVNWEAIRSEFGWIFPVDYRDFIGVYGMGNIGDSLAILAPPFPGYPYGTHLLDGEPFPPPSGELRWAVNESGDDFLWDCSDPDPDRWTVFLSSGRAGRVCYDMGMAEFLLSVVTGRLVPPTSTFPTDPAEFENWRNEQRRMDEWTF